MAFAREHNLHALDSLLRVASGGRVVRVENNRHLRPDPHPENREALDQPFARCLQRGFSKQPFELRPGVDHVVPVDDHVLHQLGTQRKRMFIWPMTIKAWSMPRPLVSWTTNWKKT